MIQKEEKELMTKEEKYKDKNRRLRMSQEFVGEREQQGRKDRSKKEYIMKAGDEKAKVSKKT